MNHEGFIRSFKVERGKSDKYPYSIPAIRAASNVVLSPAVTFFVGENGSGKSTIMEALAVNAGFNAEGGSKNFSFSTNQNESVLYQTLRLVRNPRREKTGFFLRAESFYNVATNIDELDKGGGGPKLIDSYGGVSLHHQSHGESFMALVTNRFGSNGLYVLDEPEAALSPTRQLALLANIHRLIKEGSQFIIATHSPILLAYPEAYIYQLDADGMQRVEYEELTHYTLTKDFLNHTELYRKRLFEE